MTLLEALASNSSMAATLGSYSALTGDWRRIVRDLDTVSAPPPPPPPPGPACAHAARHLVCTGILHAFEVRREASQHC